MKVTTETQAFSKVLVTLMGNYEYVISMLSITGILFVSTVLQFWLANYIEQVLGITSALAESYVAFTCFTAPISGVIVGGAVSSYYGGYNSHRPQ